MPTINQGLVGVVQGSSSADFRALNAHLLSPKTPDPYALPKSAYEGAEIKAAGRKKRLRQKSGDGMNKWERAWLENMAEDYAHIHREVSLPLANGLRYKLDFLCHSISTNEIVGYEVKGRALPAGIAKLKMAARVYPWIKFVMVSKRRKRDGGGWDKQEILK